MQQFKAKKDWLLQLREIKADLKKLESCPVPIEYREIFHPQKN